jgi:hypothetical protein
MEEISNGAQADKQVITRINNKEYKAIKMARGDINSFYLNIEFR